MKTSKTILFILLGLAVSCNEPKRYAETRVIKIEGKPVTLAYMYHIDKGHIEYTYTGHLNGKVGVCGSFECQNIAENDFTERCFKGDILEGNFSQLIPIGSGEEEMDAGEYRCLVFIPETENTKGEITVEFKEASFWESK